jgi:glycerol-3-phosphate acyltransferase PlsX
MRIALDAMGGDHAPAATVEGALEAVRRYDDLHVLLVGDPPAVEEALTAALGGDRAVGGDGPASRLRIVGSEGVVEMNDEPVRAMKAKPRCSARVAAELLGSGDAEGVVNLGSTGAAVAAATLFTRRLPGVSRPGIAVPFPRRQGVTLVVDCGGIVDARPEHLHQLAIVARHLARAAYGVAAPRIGILSVGEEEHKGNKLVHDTWELFRRHPVEGFVGNVEGRDVFGDVADVVVCDGFVGNVLLKATEGAFELLAGLVKSTLAARPDGGPLAREVLGAVRSKIDYAEYGGALLVGLHGAYVIGHGRSEARAVTNAIRVAREYAVSGVESRILEELAASVDKT